MIRLKPIIAPDARARFERLARFSAYFEEHGIAFVESDHHAVLLSQKMIPRTRLHSDEKFIVLVKNDSATIQAGWTRKALAKSNVLALFKNTIYRNRNWYNQPSCGHGRRFAYLINLYAKMERPRSRRHIAAECLNKIRLVPWDREITPDCLNFHFNYTPEELVGLDRPIDISFYGSTTYRRVELLSWHRKRCIEEMKSLPGTFEVDFCSSRVLELDEYARRLLASKICVSPWGWGEFCYRDIEAMHCGCILIKPNSDFVETFPQLYQSGKTYVPCAPDFHDLAEQVRRVLGHRRDYDQMIMRNRKLVDTFDFKDCLELFVREVKRCLSFEPEAGVIS